jgi:hypothetical protein
VHSLNNISLIAYALEAGGGDFDRSNCLTVMGGWDTDSNGATVGAVTGALPGADGIALRLSDPLRGRLVTSIPDATGRAPKLGPTMQVAFAVADAGNPVYTETMRDVEEGMASSVARLLVSSTGHDITDLFALVRSLSRGYSDGLIISPLRRSPDLVDALVHAPVPVALVGDIGEGTPLDTVRTDSHLGVVLAHRHLLDTGVVGSRS